MGLKKGGNAKQEAGRARKVANEYAKHQKAAEAAEAMENAEWSKGAKGKGAKQQADEDRKAAAAARKAENARLLAEEENSMPSKAQAATKVGAKKAAAPPKPAGPGALAADGGLGSISAAAPTVKKDDGTYGEKPEEFSATGLDDALDLLSIVNAKSDKASVGAAAGKIDSHPERRFKAMFEAYKERELPNLRKEHPGLRLQQYEELLYKQFQKSPENPFNQQFVTYNATQEEKVAALHAARAETAERLRQ